MAKENTVVAFLIGAGDGGALFMDSYQHPTSDLELVGILDNDEKKKAKSLGNPSFGFLWWSTRIGKTLQSWKSYRCDSVSDPSEYERILQMCNHIGVNALRCRWLNQ